MSRLSKYRLRLIEQLLKLYTIKRKSSYSCTIVGLEIYDDPEVMFQSGQQTRSSSFSSASAVSSSSSSSPSNHHLQPASNVVVGDGCAWTYQGPPGSDPEVIAAGLGYLVVLLNMLASYMAIRLPYTSVFHGSHSYVIFNNHDPTSVSTSAAAISTLANGSTHSAAAVGGVGGGDIIEDRYYLTLLDNTNPNHFRRAITLLNHNIIYFCERLTTSFGGNGDTSYAASTISSSSILSSFAPLHLLPNTLKLIEILTLHLRSQSDSKYVADERRERQAREILTNRIQRATGQQIGDSNLNVNNTLASSPTSAYPHLQTHQSHYFHAPPALDASMAMSQSIVNVTKQDAYPTHIATSPSTRTNQHQTLQQLISPSSTRSAPPNQLVLQRLESPPFYSDTSNAMAAFSQLDSPSDSYAYGLASPPRGSPTRPPRTPSSTSLSRAASTGGHLNSLQRSELLTGSTFFGLPPNGYLSAEEPRESVLLQAPVRQSSQTTMVHQPNRMATIAAAGTNTRDSPATTADAAIMKTAYTRSISGSTSLGDSPITPSVASLSSSSSSGSIGLSPSSLASAAAAASRAFTTPIHFQHAVAAAMQMAPFQFGHPQQRYPPQPHPHPVSKDGRAWPLQPPARPAVSYASEAEVDWDLVDVVTDETER